jgi:hypothetical protein
MQRSGNFIVLLQPGTAAQDLGQPKLTNSTLHVLDLTLRWGRGLDPLRGLPTDTADHVSMGEGLGSALRRLQVQRGRNGLSDAGMQRGSAARDNEGAVGLTPRQRPVAGRGTDKGSMISQ